MLVDPNDAIVEVDLVGASNISTDTKDNSRSIVPTAIESIDFLAQFYFPTDEIINEIKGYKSFLEVGNDMATLTLSDIAKSELNASLSDALMLTLTTELRVHSERAKGRFFYVKLAIAYEVAFRYCHY